MPHEETISQIWEGYVAERDASGVEFRTYQKTTNILVIQTMKELKEAVIGTNGTISKCQEHNMPRIDALEKKAGEAAVAVKAGWSTAKVIAVVVTSVIGTLAVLAPLAIIVIKYFVSQPKP